MKLFTYISDNYYYVVIFLKNFVNLTRYTEERGTTPRASVFSLKSKENRFKKWGCKIHVWEPDSDFRWGLGDRCAGVGDGRK